MSLYSSLYSRAEAIVPNIVFGHRRIFAVVENEIKPLPKQYPHFIVKAKGCHIWDDHGNKHIDYMCGYGPMIVGYANDEVDNAAINEIKNGFSYNLCSEPYIALCEFLVQQIYGAEWATLALSGSDAVDLCLLIARAYTQKKGIVLSDGAFHGHRQWCDSGLGRFEDDRQFTYRIPWGDITALRETLSQKSIAAVILCPFSQVVGSENTMPPRGFWTEVRKCCDENNVLLVLDDVRSGFRLHPNGSSAYFDIDADLIAMSKAIANGYPLSAVVGRKHLWGIAQSVFSSGTFWGSPVSCAAALKTMEILVRENAWVHMSKVGKHLTDGLQSIGANYDFNLTVSGPSACPIVLFSDDPQYILAQRFSLEMSKCGSFLNPTHNWFLSLAHTEEDINQTLEHAKIVFRKLREIYY